MYRNSQGNGYQRIRYTDAILCRLLYVLLRKPYWGYEHTQKYKSHP